MQNIENSDTRPLPEGWMQHYDPAYVISSSTVKCESSSSRHSHMQKGNVVSGFDALMTLHGYIDHILQVLCAPYVDAPTGVPKPSC